MDSALVAGSAREWGRRAPRRGASAESLGLSHTTLTGVESWVSEATPATGSIPQAECWLSGPVPSDGPPANHLTSVAYTRRVDVLTATFSRLTAAQHLRVSHLS